MGVNSCLKKDGFELHWCFEEGDSTEAGICGFGWRCCERSCSRWYYQWLLHRWRWKSGKIFFTYWFFDLICMYCTPSVWWNAFVVLLERKSNFCIDVMRLCVNLQKNWVKIWDLLLLFWNIICLMLLSPPSFLVNYFFHSFFSMKHQTLAEK